jgi:hypothetical protein
VDRDGVPILPVSIGLAAGIGFVILLALLLSIQQSPTTSETSGSNNTSLENNATSTSFRAIEIVPYNFTSGEGKIKSMEVQLDWPEIRVSVEVPRNSTLEIHLPVQLLKQMEIGSGLKYCVENGFAVFVDNQIVESNIVKQTDKEQVLAIPLKSSSKVIEISGISLLMSPPTCN